MRTLLFFFLIFLTAGSAHALTVPEHLQYDLTIGGVKVGSMEMDVREKTRYIEVTSHVSSAAWISPFYKVDDKAVSLLAAMNKAQGATSFRFAPLLYNVELTEHKYRVRKESRFDQARKSIDYFDHVTEQRAFFALAGNVLDPLSGFYYIRETPLVIGKSVSLRIFNNKKIYLVKVQVLRRERLKTPLGAVDTILVRTNMDSVGDGIFFYPGDIYIWFSDDQKRIPVMIEKRLKALVEGRLPEYLKNSLPSFVKEKLGEGAISAVLIKG